MEAYEKRVAKSAAVTALWCVVELNVKVCYESETCFRAQYAVFENGPTGSLSEPATGLWCPRRSGEGLRGRGLLQRCQSRFQTSRS